MQLAKYSMGIGDRFGHQARAQMRAIIKARAVGAAIAPVWNKSNREHTIIGTCPMDVRNAVEAAIRAYSFNGEYHVDADHISLKNVDWFMDSSDFFTLDVADYIGKPVATDQVEAFLAKHSDLWGVSIAIPGLNGGAMTISADEACKIANTYLFAVQEAGRLYRHIIEAKGGADRIVAEISMDETEAPQQPREMFLILVMIADEKLPVQTIAPKFTGRFNKGVDYVGDLAQFEREFNDDLAVIAYAVKNYELAANLKLSIHSGSDKFSIYPIMRKAIRRFDAGLHLKTAGTTWLEEVIGLAEAGGEGLALAKAIYREAHGRYAELSAPYATVIDIEPDKLPLPDEVDTWDSAHFTSVLRHDQSNPLFNRQFRQMVHVAFKVAAEMGPRFYGALDTHRAVIERNVYENIFTRHITPLFLQK